MRINILVVTLLAALSTAAASDRDPQVVGGHPVTPGQFPFVVRVNVPGGSCTGSLIRDNWVLTAAHCGGFGTPLSVLIGDAESGKDGPGHIVSTLAVADWIPHPQYNAEANDYDIALIRLASNASQSPPRLNGVVEYLPQPVALATTPNTSGPELGTVSVVGFGRIDNNGPVTDNPGFAYFATGLASRSPGECSYLDTATNTTRQLCYAYYPNACQGDSGGPVFQIRSGSPVQVGVVSNGPTTCGIGPSIATFVPGFTTWINQQIDGTPPPSSPIQYGWELPPSTANGIASGIANFQGWAFSTAGSISSVRLERNGSTVITAPCCSERGDVKNSIPGAPLNTGFAAVVNWGNQGDGTNNFTLVIRDSAGNERRETRSVQTVQILNGVPFTSNLGFTNNTQCELIDFNGRAGFECSGLSFQQGTCNGKITFAWLNGKQAVEVVDGCH